MLLIYTTTIIFIIYIVLDLTWRIWKRKLSFIPSVRNVPWLGNIPFFSGNAHVVYKKMLLYQKEHNHLYIIWFGWIPIIRTGCVEYIEPLLKDHKNMTKSFFYYIVQEWLGDGLLISTGEKWKKRRSALTKAFHFNILNDFVEIYKKHAENLVQKLQRLAVNGNGIEVQWQVSLALLDVICETSMGVVVNALHSSDSEYVRAVRDIKTLLLKRISNPIFLNKAVYRLTANGKKYFKCLDILHNFTIDVINKNIASRRNLSTCSAESEDNQEHSRKRRVLVDVLLDLYDKGEIDIEGIREEVDTFMFEGHDTTSSALSWTLYEIGRHPDIQKKLHEEINIVSAEECSLIDKLRLLKYMECVLKESLRLHPAVPRFNRKIEEEIVIGGNIIPRGTIVSVDAISVHTNPAYWVKPEVFNPDRFLSEEFLKRNPFCYIPFSAGPRNCIGQRFAMLEEKVFLYFILTNFNINSLQTPDELEIAFDLIVHSQNGINIEFICRNQ